MKLVKQTKLFYQDNKSDKVYEVDLCNVGTSEYVVNFRYGKRGGVLKEGTKTDLPVSLSNAQELFEKLVSAKTKKGYLEEGTKTKALKTTSARPKLDRNTAILGHLQLAVENPKKQALKNWNIKRVMWRAGEVEIKEAVPYLIQLCNHKDALHQYTAIWAIGRCEGGQEAMPVLLEIMQGEYAAMVKRMAEEVYLSTVDVPTRNEYFKQVLKRILPAVQTEIEEGNKETLNQILHELVFNRKQKSYNFIYLLYQLGLSYPHVRASVLELMHKMPLAAPHFRTVRHIFKAAEYRQDAAMLGVLAKRFEKEKEAFRIPQYGNSIWFGRKSVDFKEELKKDNSILAFSNKTKKYFVRRVWNTLKRTADLEKVNYVKMAVGILLAYNDKKDRTAPKVRRNWFWDRVKRKYTNTEIHFDSYADYTTFNKILYSNSTRYKFVDGKLQCTNGYKPGDTVPAEREEAYPELWDKAPKAYVHLLAESMCERVSDFALKNFKACKEYSNLLARFDNNLVVKLLEKPFAKTAHFGLDLAKERYNKSNPDKNITLVMLSSKFEDIRQQASQWISENHDLYFADNGFIMGMLTHQFTDLRSWMRQEIPMIAPKMPQIQKEDLVDRIIKHILSLSVHTDNNQTVRELADTLWIGFRNELTSIDLEVIRNLLAAPPKGKKALEERQNFARQLILQHETTADEMPNDIIQTLLKIPRPIIRQVGTNLLKTCKDETLLEKEALLVEACTSRFEDVRKAVRPIIARLITKDEDFAARLVENFVPVLLRKERYEGLHDDTYRLLTETLEKQLSLVERSMIFRLLNSEHIKAQELAALLLEKYIPAESLSVRNIIRLADHELINVRRTCWKMFEENVSRMQYEREDALRLLDAKWDDSRAFAFNYFRDNFTKREWTPDLIVSVCDSVREDVQGFGRELITKYFEDEDGPQYLLKLSQHPKPELQTLAANYLARFATGDMEKMRFLEPYFITVLSLVNKGRTAKNRVLHFLRNEAMNSEEAAQLVARIMTRLSMTVAVGDKSEAIELMRDIHEKYPHIQMPIMLRSIETIGQES